ncbi:Transcription termination factor MTERF6, chloroplastic/mitochondrial-like protein [Drosera capensis]
MATTLTPPPPRASPSSSSNPTRLLPVLIPTRLPPTPHLTLYSPFSFGLRRRPLSSAASITPFEEDANKEAEKEEEAEEEKDEDEEEEERMVREAIAETLLEFGASEEESEEIVAKSVAYARMLRDEVRELDENSLWKSWFMQRRRGVAAEEEIEELSLKRKVKLLAKEKGDGGKIACLESVGLGLGFATRIARALSKLTLNGLIRRVKYVKEIFFSGSDNQIIGKVARHMMLHLSIPVHEDLQLTLAFFEKLEARRGGLDMLGFEDPSLSVLIESFPGILSLPMEATIERLFEFLEEIGVPRQRFESILLLYPPILFLDLKKEIKPGIHAYYKADILRGNMGKLLKKYPWILSASILENFEKVVSSLEAFEVPKSRVYRAIRRFPIILGCSSDKFRPMIQEIHKLGVPPKKLGKVIARCPQILLRKPEVLLKVVAFLQDLGVGNEGLRKIMIRCPEIYIYRIDISLQRKVDYLTQIRISERQLSHVIEMFPEVLILSFDTSVPAKIDYLRSIGFSDADIAFMIVGFPPLLKYNLETVLKPKMEFLLNIMGKSLGEVVDYPRYFSYSLEKRIMPRFFVLKRRNIICSLREMFGKNDEDFETAYLDITNAELQLLLQVRHVVADD